jgi:hypothetical protein
MASALDTDFQQGNGLMIPKVIKVDLYQPQLCSRTNKSIGIFFIFIYPPQDQKYNFENHRNFLRISGPLMPGNKEP